MKQNSQPIQCNVSRVAVSSEIAPARVVATNDNLLLNVVVERDLTNSRNSSSSSNVSTSSGSYCSNSSGEDDLSSSQAPAIIPSSNQKHDTTPTATTKNDETSFAAHFDKLSLAHLNPTAATPTQATTLNPTTTSPDMSTVTSLRTHPLYKMQEKIRSGGFGHVYKGTRLDDNSPIAIKIVPKDKISSWHKIVNYFNFF
jgi:hypothetical protein